MDREAVIRMAREATRRDDWWDDDQALERFAALVAAAEREKLASWMMSQGYATGHGDSIEKLLEELEWQIEERIRNEREVCAKVCDEEGLLWSQRYAAAIRARGNT